MAGNRRISPGRRDVMSKPTQIECQHEYMLGPRAWPMICKHCYRQKSEIQLDELLVKLQEAIAYIEMMDEANKPGHEIWAFLYEVQELIAQAKNVEMEICDD